MPRISRFGKHTFTKSFPNGFLNTGSLVEHGNWLMTHSHEFWWWFECLQTCRRLSVARGRCILSCLARITKLLCIEVVNIDCTKGLPLGLFCIINHTTKKVRSRQNPRSEIKLAFPRNKRKNKVASEAPNANQNYMYDKLITTLVRDFSRALILWWSNRIIKGVHVFDRSAKNIHTITVHNMDSVTIQYYQSTPFSRARKGFHAN